MTLLIRKCLCGQVFGCKDEDWIRECWLCSYENTELCALMAKDTDETTGLCRFCAEKRRYKK